MKKFKLYNTILGWIVFLIAAYTYLSTMEPTASLWDCGEFIATSYKLEVGHPPGAPFFMLVQKVMSLLAGNNVHKVAYWMNVTSALSSAFTILFLFWTISYIARRIILKIKNKDTLNTAESIAVLGSATVGALAYTFSDTFWFSAVEAEVYAMSSMFTAITFWIALKWDEQADKPYAYRWLILLGLLIGMAIGVHLLNLLVIPAVSIIIYYRLFVDNKNISLKKENTGLLVSFIIGSLVLLFIMYGIIQGLVALGSQFELLFVNTFGLPFESGFITFLLLLFGVLIYGIIYSIKHRKYILHDILLFTIMILIGYSVFAIIVIRSNANPPIDENNPEYSFALKAYLNREQYGNRPLLYGPYYDAQIIGEEPIYTYYKDDSLKKYIKIKKTNPNYKYDPNRETIFPRMYSQEKDHIEGYKAWGGVEPGEKPNFINNLKFFFNYQLGFMYFRYMFWNFVGKQNDIQGHGGILHGNWLSGINFIDNARLGPQDKIPTKWKNKASRNKFYFLPLILGILGLLYSLYHRKYFWAILVFFFMTGIAIVIYLNQTPYQPRERDYAYAGSFYAYAIWIGLGVLAIYDMLKRLLKSETTNAIIASLLGLTIPILMGSQTWDDHDRSGRYHTRDLAADYLNSCDKYAILFTYGDNDTFPLWYDQETEGIRTDVRDVNLSLFSTDWYIDQMKRKAYESDPLPIPISKKKYREGTRDIIIINENPNLFVNEKYQANKKLFINQYKKLYEHTMRMLSASEFPKIFQKDYKTLSEKGYEKITPMTLLNLLNRLKQKNILEKTKVNPDTLDYLKVKTTELVKQIKNSYLPIKIAMDFVLSDDPATKIGNGAYDYLPTRKLLIPVDKQKIIKAGFVPPDKHNQIVDAIRFTLPKKQYLLKSQWMVLLILANFNWDRPIYFATSIGTENYLGLQKYFRLEGFAYRLVPYETKPKNGVFGDINTDILYNNLMNKFKWGRIYEPDFNVDHYVDRVTKVMDIRGVFHRLASKLIEEHKNDSAKAVLNKIVHIMPDNKFPFDYFFVPIIEDYYKINMNKTADSLARITFNNYKEECEFYKSLSNDKLNTEEIQRNLGLAYFTFGKLADITKNNNDSLSNEITQYSSTILPLLSNKFFK